MRTANFLISAAFCLAVLGTPAAAPNARSIMLAQADRTPSPNALDAQDRFRDRERERAHEEVKERLGDRSPRLPTNNSQGFEAPTTNLKPDVPDERTKSNQNR
jgi:hypothetical protein